MSRFPYTHACDMIREIVGPQVSRSEASQLRQKIAEIIDIPDEELAAKLAIYFMRKHDLLPQPTMTSEELMALTRG